MVVRSEINQYNRLLVDLYGFLPLTIINQDQANSQADSFGQWDLAGAAWDVPGAKWDVKGQSQGPILQRFFWAIETNEAEMLAEMAGEISPLIIGEEVGLGAAGVTTFTGTLGYTPVTPQSIEFFGPNPSDNLPTYVIEDNGDDTTKIHELRNVTMNPVAFTITHDRRIVPGTVTLAAEGMLIEDDGAGNLVGDVDGTFTNTIDYDTGAVSFKWSAVPGAPYTLTEQHREENLAGDGHGYLDYTTGEYYVIFNYAPRTSALVTADYEFDVERSARKPSGLPGLFDVDKCPEEYLPYLAAKLGGNIDENLPIEAKRFYVKALVPTWKTKGTDVSYQILFRARYLGIQIFPLFKASINEAKGNYSRVQDLTHPYPAARVDVEVVAGTQTDLSQASFDAIMNLLHLTKPAHVLLRNVVVKIGPVVDVAGISDNNVCCDPTYRYEPVGCGDVCAGITTTATAATADRMLFDEGLFLYEDADAGTFKQVATGVGGAFIVGETVNSGAATLLAIATLGALTLFFFDVAVPAGAITGDDSSATATVGAAISADTVKLTGGAPSGEFLPGETLNSGQSRVLAWRALADGNVVLYVSEILGDISAVGDTSGASCAILTQVAAESERVRAVPEGDVGPTPCADDLHVRVCPGECNEQRFVV